jgi:hypothetical protein
MKYWEIIADNLSKAGWSCGCVSAIHSNARTIWIADAHRDGGRRSIVHADEKLTAFVELESAISEILNQAEDNSPARFFAQKSKFRAARAPESLCKR